MILLTKGNTDLITVTLKEKTTLVSPYYLFVFESQETKDIVKFVAPSDTSYYKDRYNLFSITTNTYFNSYKVGDWNYTVYEQVSSSNTDIANTTGIVEKGIMKLNPSTSFEPTEYNPSTIVTKIYQPS